jgi:hypothetical protein
MKNLLSVLFILFLSGHCLFAQAPQSFNYQAVARDASGNPLPNEDVSFRISILSGSVSGTTQYREVHIVTTNTLGLVNLAIGKGTAQFGDFSSINWGSDEHFVKVEMDVTGGTNYLLFGTSQLLSVPYALHAKTSESSEWKKDADGIYYNDGNVGIGNSSDELAAFSINRNVDDGFGRYFMVLHNSSISSKSNAAIKLSAGSTTINNKYLELTQYGPTYTALPDYFDFGGIVNQGGRGIIVGLETTGVFKIMSGFTIQSSTELLRVNSTGMGIGTSVPKSKLQITNGDVYIESVNKGVIMKSPNGSCFRMTVNNSGVPVFTAITCP